MNKSTAVENMQSVKLLEKVSLRDPEATAALIEKIDPVIQRAVLREAYGPKGRNCPLLRTMDVDDLSQHTYTKLFGRTTSGDYYICERYDPARGSLNHFVRLTARTQTSNLIVSLNAKCRRGEYLSKDGVIEQADTKSSAETILSTHQLFEAFNILLLEKLTDIEKRVFNYRFKLSRRIAQISDAEGISHNAVSQHLSRIRKKARLVLQEMNGESVASPSQAAPDKAEDRPTLT